MRRVGDKVRVVVQLIDAQNDKHLWGETYDRDFKDVLSLQSEIAVEIANALEIKLTSSEKEKIQKEITTDVTAYDYYLKARNSLNTTSSSKRNFTDIMELVNKAIELDPLFSPPYELKAQIWLRLRSFGLPQKVWVDSAFLNASKSIELDSQNSKGYLVHTNIYKILGNLSAIEQSIKRAYKSNPKDPQVQAEYGYQLLMEGDERGADMVLKSIERSYSTNQAEYYESLEDPLFIIEDYDSVIKILKKAIDRNPKRNYYLGGLVTAYWRNHQYDEALQAAERQLNHNAESTAAIGNIAWSFFYKKEYKKAAEYWSKYPEIEGRFQDKTQTVPFRNRLAMALLKMGETKRIKELVLEDENIQRRMLDKISSTGTWGTKGNIYYGLALDKALLGLDQQAVQYLDSAFIYLYRYKESYENDPVFEKIRSLSSFRMVQEKMDNFHGFRKKAFINAFNRAKASRELKGLREK